MSSTSHSLNAGIQTEASCWGREWVKTELEVPTENIGTYLVICDNCVSTRLNTPMHNTYTTLVNGMHNSPPWRHHYWVLAFSKDLSPLGLYCKPRRQKGESTYKHWWWGRTEYSHPAPQSPKQYIWILCLWKQTSIYTTQIYHAPVLGRHPTSPSCSLKQNLLAVTVVAMKYDQTGVIFLIPVQLWNQSPGETNEFIPSLPSHRVSGCKAAGFSLLA